MQTREGIRTGIETLSLNGITCAASTSNDASVKKCKKGKAS